MIQDERYGTYTQPGSLPYPLIDVALGHGVGEVSKLVKYLAVNPVYLIIPYNWKSHATLTLLAKQECPLWLQYD